MTTTSEEIVFNGSGHAMTARERIAKLENVLRWYADIDNYCDYQPILNDFGKRAREVL